MHVKLERYCPSLYSEGCLVTTPTLLRTVGLVTIDARLPVFAVGGLPQPAQHLNKQGPRSALAHDSDFGFLDVTGDQPGGPWLANQHGSALWQLRQQQATQGRWRLSLRRA